MSCRPGFCCLHGAGMDFPSAPVVWGSQNIKALGISRSPRKHSAKSPYFLMRTQVCRGLATSLDGQDKTVPHA